MAGRKILNEQEARQCLAAAKSSRAVFQYEADKASPQLVGKRQAFCGTLTADAEHRLNAVYASGRVLEAGCNAHGRRKFRDGEETQPTLAAEGGGFIAAMYVEEARAQQLALTGEALVEHRRRFISVATDVEVIQFRRHHREPEDRSVARRRFFA